MPAARRLARCLFPLFFAAAFAAAGTGREAPGRALLDETARRAEVPEASAGGEAAGRVARVLAGMAGAEGSWGGGSGSLVSFGRTDAKGSCSWPGGSGRG